MSKKREYIGRKCIECKKYLSTMILGNNSAFSEACTNEICNRYGLSTVVADEDEEA